jgi:hypothetical protein
MESAMVRTILACAAVFALVAACSPGGKSGPPATPAPTSAPQISGADAITPGNPFFGGWGLEGAKIAPWWDHKGEEPAPDPAMAEISFTADKSSGPPLLTCDKPKYALNIAPPRALFGGNLPDPMKDAAALGFNPEGISTLTFTCASGTMDVSLDFPMMNDDTIMLGLDNVIYTFKRTRG